jgi:hypothetical protein
MTIDGLPPLRDVIERHELRARKSLGQNFLLDLNLTGKIARTAGDLSACTVLEIGPGPGGLTRALLAHGAKDVVAVERDERCLGALADIAEHYPGRLTVIPGDALTVDLKAAAGAGPVKIVANLPYNVGTELLIRWLTLDDWPPYYESMTLMFQREVAERIVARPATDAYGRLGVLAGWRSRGANCFRRSATGVHTAAKGHLVGRASNCHAPTRCRRMFACLVASPKRPSASDARCCGRASNRSAERRLLANVGHRRHTPRGNADDR